MKFRKKKMEAQVVKLVYAIKVEDVNENITQEVAISDEFESVAELREEMKEKGYDRYDYQVIYAYEMWVDDYHVGTGRGLTASEAKHDLELEMLTTVEMVKRHPERFYPC